MRASKVLDVQCAVGFSELTDRVDPGDGRIVEDKIDGSRETTEGVVMLAGGRRLRRSCVRGNMRL